MFCANNKTNENNICDAIAAKQNFKQKQKIHALTQRV